MEFGKINAEELEAIDTSLPGDPPETVPFLNTYRTAATPQIYVGCAKWGRKDWVGKIYPEGTKESDFLKLYGKHFNSIELNATFYRLPSKRQTAEWKSKVGPEFRFCPKVSQSISHIRRLKDVDEAVERFLDGISGFGETLGAVFLMPHPSMGPKSMDVLESFISQFPSDIRLFVELRHRQWFSDPQTTRSSIAVFQQHRVGVVITDVLGRRDCLHMRLTVPEAFVRFVGNGLHPTDYRRIDDWARRIRQWTDAGLQKLYFFMHQEDEVHSPELSRYAIERFNAECGLSIPVPQFLS